MRCSSLADDKDLAQCVTDSGRIRLYRPSTEQTWYESDVQLNFDPSPKIPNAPPDPPPDNALCPCVSLPANNQPNTVRRI
jgi:hypothetical protein